MCECITDSLLHCHSKLNVQIMNKTYHNMRVYTYLIKKGQGTTWSALTFEPLPLMTFHFFRDRGLSGGSNK